MSYWGNFCGLFELKQLLLHNNSPHYGNSFSVYGSSPKTSVHINITYVHTVYMVHLMVILIWRFGKFVFICQIKCTHCLHSFVSIRDLDSPCRQTKYLPIYITYTNSPNFMSTKCTTYTRTVHIILHVKLFR